MPPERKKPRDSHHTVKLLLIILTLLLVALPTSRHFLFVTLPAPPKTAKLSTKMKYYSQRITNNPTDVSAYIELGKLDESAGYYMDALHRFYAARALGANDKEIVLPLARSLAFLGHYDDAKIESDKAVSLMPDSFEAASELAEVLQAEGKLSESSTIIANYLARHPKIEKDASPDGISRIHRMIYYFLSDSQSDMALRLANDLVAVSPTEPEGYSVSGQLLILLKNPKGAVDRLSTAVKLSPDNASVHYNYGVALAAIGREPDAMIQWQRSMTLDPKSLNACYRLAEAYDRRKDYKHCSMALQTIALSDMSSSGAATAAAFAFKKAGQPVPAAYWSSVGAAAKRDYKAQLSYATLAAKDPKWRRRALGSIASAYHSLNRVNDYIDTMKQATPGDAAEDDIAMAAVYGSADLIDDQNRLLKRALTKSPKNPAKIYVQLSEVAQRQGLRDDAESDIQKAIAIRPDFSTYHGALGALYLERRSEGGRLASSVAEFKMLIQLDPYNVDGYQQLGIAYEAQGDLRRASHALEHALDLSPGDGATYQELARVYAKMGDKTGSSTMFALYKRYVDFDLQQKNLSTQSRARAKDPKPQIALGDFLAKSGNYAEALQYYRLALSLKSGDLDIKAKIQHMDSMLGQAAD